MKAVTRVGKNSEATNSAVTMPLPGVLRKTSAYPASVAQTVVISTVMLVTKRLFR